MKKLIIPLLVLGLFIGISAEAYTSSAGRSYSAPSRSYSAPSRSYSAPVRTYTPPAALTRTYTPSATTYTAPVRTYTPPATPKPSVEAPRPVTAPVAVQSAPKVVYHTSYNPLSSNFFLWYWLFFHNDSAPRVITNNVATSTATTTNGNF